MTLVAVLLRMISPANAFHGRSDGGSFGGLFHHHHGSSGASSEGNHEDDDEHGEHHGVSDRGERVMEAPSRDVRRDANGVIIDDRDRERRRRNDNDADRNRDGDKKHDKDMRKRRAQNLEAVMSIRPGSARSRRGGPCWRTSRGARSAIRLKCVPSGVDFDRSDE
jgi:hypothetical protein